jgi:hypothetical protein
MARPTTPGMTVERLAEDLLDGTPTDPFADELGAWLAASPRFRAFAEANRSKVRKKLRGAADAEARRDVRAELGVAHLLLADRRIELKFEAYGSGRAGPDFTVTFRGGRAFNLEVTRLRRSPDAPGQGGQLLAKLHQLPPSVPNAILVAFPGDRADAFDVAAATRALRARADRKDEAFFVDRGFDGTRGFYERYLRLGAVLVWCESAVGDMGATLWNNSSARIAIPARAARECLLRLRAASGDPRTRGVSS